MSYILDALRRADAERGRGAVPSLHTPAAPGLGASSTAAGRPAGVHPALLASGVAAVAVLAAGATWWLLEARTGPASAVVAAVPGPTTAQAPAPAPSPSPSQSAAPPAQAAPGQAAPEAAAPPSSPLAAPPAAAPAPPPPVAAAKPASPPQPEDRRTPPRVRERDRPAPPGAGQAAVSAAERRTPSSREAAAPQNGRTPVAAAPVNAAPATVSPGALPAVPAPRNAAEHGGAPPPPASPVYAQGDLPESLRTQLPALKVTGATHSSNALYRMAIVNGQVMREGEQAAPGLVLERIEPGRTVWAFKGYRYAVAAQ